ncbi:hypothetical protein LAZ67_1003689 [Cordylochernes scorpioides]|uniref:Integrase catalytic domain-containing protein n=1 Tax=Cordylochernes scorpioides TaxID=51811 RepID=A0ABY6JZU6_9ARAC|nr:hypothetical protein LAZ67_1003689 [Cordylochernes scorpioides]
MPGHRKRRQFKQTDAFTRGMVIGLKRAGWSIRQIAADTHLGASTVHRLWRRWLEQGNVAIYRNVGATRVTSTRVDRRILRQAVAAPQATCTAILQHVQDTLDHSISTRTISRRLVANGLHSCRPLRRLPLTPPNRRQRLEWCRARSTWMTEWHRVVFSDSRRVRVWRRRGERSNPAAIVERPTVRQRGIMFWGAIVYDSRSPLLRIQGTMTAQRYVDDVLRPVTLPYLQGVPNALYQQDNARPQTARISQQALQDNQRPITPTLQAHFAAIGRLQGPRLHPPWSPQAPPAIPGAGVPDLRCAREVPLLEHRLGQRRRRGGYCRGLAFRRRIHRPSVRLRLPGPRLPGVPAPPTGLRGLDPLALRRGGRDNTGRGLPDRRFPSPERREAGLCRQRRALQHRYGAAATSPGDDPRYSGYPEVFTLDPPTAINVKNKLRETFARFGIPETMMSDNGPPFRSEIMTDFCIRWGIKQLFSSPHLHRSNGLAERNIQTIKNQLIKCRDEGSDPYLAILAYRNTPKNDLPSPAQLCLSRSLRCQIPRITPLYRPYQTNWRSIGNAKRKRQSSMKEQYDRNSKSYPKVNVGEDAWCQIHPRETWTPVKISAQADSPQSFEVVTPSGNRLIRNQQFIRPRDGGYEKSQLSSEPITASPEAQHPQCDSPTMGESSTAPIQRSSEETNFDQREGATTSAGISPETSGRPRFSRFGRELRKPQRFCF